MDTHQVCSSAVKGEGGAVVDGDQSGLSVHSEEGRGDAVTDDLVHQRALARQTQASSARPSETNAGVISKT